MFLASNLKKPKENQCFWLRTLKYLRKINVFAPPAWGTQGRFWTGCCVSGGSASEFREAHFYCEKMFLNSFSGIGDPFLALTIKKPKENLCFWIRTLKNLGKIYVFGFEP